MPNRKDKKDRKPTRLRAKLLLLVAGLICGLLIAEIFLRVIGFRNLNLYITDPYVGFTLRPGAEGLWRGEGTTYIKINSEGLRDREHSKQKPPNTLRIAVLGDSFTEALDVEMQDAWWAIMEQRLQGCDALAGRKVEVINFGVAGFSTARELITLQKRAWQYSPDVVVLNLTTINDIKDNSKILNKEYASLPLPYFIYKGDQLVLDDSQLVARNNSLYFRLQQTFLGGVMNWLRDHLRLVGLVDKARIAYQQRKIRNQQANAPREVEGWDIDVFREPKDAAWAEAWRVTEGTLLLMRDEVKSKGAKFLVATGSSGIQLNPDAAARSATMRELGVENLFYPDQRIKALGEREGFPVLNLAQPMQEYADRNKVFLHGQGSLTGYGHWNQAGNRVAGELIARKLCEDILVAKQP
ncbi:MAG: SGNH/GDSL hydrolase family protein [Pyrinomonadaceae bacterium]